MLCVLMPCGVRWDQSGTYEHMLCEAALQAYHDAVKMIMPSRVWLEPDLLHDVYSGCEMPCSAS